MQSALLHFANIISALLPQSRAFAARRVLYRLAGVKLESNVRLNGGSVIQYPNVFIGSNTWIGRGTEIVSTPSASVRIGDRCDVSQGVLFIVGSHTVGTRERRAGSGESRPITVGPGTWIGARATVLGGVSIGSGVIVAAGALVREDVPDNVVVAGVPAKLVRELN